MGMLKEFKEFAMKGNLVDMAVGIIMGAAFGKIVSSFVSDIIMPPLGLLMGRVDFKDLALVLQKGHPAANGVTAVPEIAIKYGQFLNTIIDFLIISFAIFMAIKQLNHVRALALTEEKTPDATTKQCQYCCSTIDIKATRCPNCTSELTSDPAATAV
jgi:large conductance mechanosensitive channel